MKLRNMGHVSVPTGESLLMKVCRESKPYWDDIQIQIHPTWFAKPAKQPMGKQWDEECVKLK